VGRHSAPDDEGELGDVLVEEQPRPRPRPRHAAPDGEEQVRALATAETEIIDPEVVERARDDPPRNVVDAVVVEDEAYSVAPKPPTSRPGEPLAELPGPAAPDVAAATKERPGRADLRLLRESSSLRARALAALILPFVLYTIALVVIGRVDVYLFWIWIPAILAGILFGSQLDAAHKQSVAPPTE
jgi:hypothetical protein